MRASFDGEQQQRVRLALMMNHTRLRIPSGSRWVEVTGSYHQTDFDSTGGGFILRDIDGTPLLAEAFPTNGFSSFHAEALALLQTMRVMIELGEDDVVFCHGSPRLQRTMIEGAELPSVRVCQMLMECAEVWGRRRGPWMVCWSKDRLAAAHWLANCGRRCQQRCRWTGPWPEELEGLF